MAGILSFLSSLKAHQPTTHEGCNCWWLWHLLFTDMAGNSPFLRGLSKKIFLIGLPYDPEIPLLDSYPKELRAESWRDICTPKFIAPVFSIAIRWKQPKCPLANKWINKMHFIHIYPFSRTAVTKYHKLGGLNNNNKNLSSHSFGGWKSKINMSAGLLSTESSLFGLQEASSHVPTMLFLCSVSLVSLLFFKGFSPIGLGSCPHELI